jgi:hypothetical protein
MDDYTRDLIQEFYLSDPQDSLEDEDDLPWADVFDGPEEFDNYEDSYETYWDLNPSLK